MKKFFLLVLLVVASSAIIAQNGAAIEFETESFDFEKIEEGPKVTTEFVFTNTGDEDLILSNVKASCGCTVPNWPKAPIAPGEEASITVTYNTANRKGTFNKSITVTSNAADGNKVIRITGTVVPATKVVEEETMPVKQPTMMTPAVN